MALQNDGAAIRHNQAVPDQKRPGLAEGHLGVVLADEPRTLRNQQNAAGWAVIDVFCDLGGDPPREIGTQPGQWSWEPRPGSPAAAGRRQRAPPPASGVAAGLQCFRNRE
jgi:hypothetical protein